MLGKIILIVQQNISFHELIVFPEAIVFPHETIGLLYIYLIERNPCFF